jgi:hypothetical protein
MRQYPRVILVGFVTLSIQRGGPGLIHHHAAITTAKAPYLAQAHAASLNRSLGGQAEMRASLAQPNKRKRGPVVDASDTLQPMWVNKPCGASELGPFVPDSRHCDALSGMSSWRPIRNIRPVSTIGNVEINAAVDCIAGVVPSCADQCLRGTDTGRFQLVGETRKAALQQILDELSAQD